MQLRSGGSGIQTYVFLTLEPTTLYSIPPWLHIMIPKNSKIPWIEKGKKKKFFFFLLHSSKEITQRL